MPSAFPQPSSIPTSPGVYTWRDADKVLYIGKAKNLRNRLRTYYKRDKLDPKTAVLMKRVKEVDWIETASEEEALILEATLIKRHQPMFNIRLKDDKVYPYLAFTDDEYPRVVITKKTEPRTWKFYGPYTSGRQLQEAVNALNSLYLNPLWKGDLNKKGNPPVSKEEWDKSIELIKGAVEGQSKWKEVARKKMQEAAKDLNYEFAATVRDWIEKVEYLTPKRAINAQDSADIIAWVENDKGANLQILQLRQGQLVGQRSFSFDAGNKFALALLEAYRLSPPPSKLYVSEIPEDTDIIKEGLGKVLQTVPKRYDRFAVTAHKNAVNTLNYTVLHEEQSSPKRKLKELERSLGLANLQRIECYDISNLGDTHPVGAMAVMIDGIPTRRLYRTWSLETAGQDDFSMIEELLSTRLKALDGKEMRIAQKPDLIVIDGGKGQLAAAIKAMKRLSISIPVISLAKEEEEVFIPGRPSPLPIQRTSPASLLLQQLRNETHWAALKRHRKKRDKAFLSDQILADVKGIGPKRKKRLLDHFGSLENLLEANQTELESLLGSRVAASIYKQLHR